MAGMTDIIILGVVAVGGYFVFTNCIQEGGTCWDLFKPSGNGNGVDCTANPTDPSCTGTTKTCDQFGGDCKNACNHGCEGANCIACLTACSESCADTNTTESCSHTCDNSFCRSFREKGCTQQCANCAGAGSAYAYALATASPYARHMSKVHRRRMPRIMVA